MHFHTRLKGVFQAIGLLLLMPGAEAAVPDGPYVLQGTAGWEAVSVQVDGDVARKQVRAVRADDTLVVPAVATAPSFTVKLRAAAPAAPDEVRIAKGVPLFIVADTHGEYETLVTLLRAHKIVGADLKWRFARGHVVVLGDVFDRGPNHLEILWLLYELEAQAAKAGGGLHLLLGNHEVMAMRGDLRYLNDKYADTARLLAQPNYSHLFAASSLLGQWLRSRPTIMKVGDYLFVHAGVSRALVDSRLTLAEINATVRSVLNDEPGQGAVADLVLGTAGPLWYRGYFPEQRGFAPATTEDVELTLQTFAARRIFIGHTIVPRVTPLYEGRVIDVQARPFECLLIRKGELFAAGVDGGLQPLAREELKRAP